MEYSLRKTKKIMLEYEILRMELEDSITLYEKYENTFLEEVFKYVEENNIIEDEPSMCREDFSEDSRQNDTVGRDKGDEERSESVEISKSKNSLSEDMKKIYKKIVLKIHPDKIMKEDGDTKEAYKVLYSKTQNAVTSSDYLEIIKIASELKIDIPELSDISISKIKINLSSIQKEIDDYKTKYPWIWFNSDDSEKEIHIKEFLDVNKNNMHNIMKHRGKS